jgi:hypothetical protein
MDFHASLEMVCLKSGLRFRRPPGVSEFELFYTGTVHGAAMATTTALVRPISLLPIKNTALYWRVSGLPAASKGRLRGCEKYPLKIS